ncbi:MAG: hypothetical protein GY789_23965 [Hyphomicrobiales bacterium]|nr:hypothetical protein [Hyphomicrobiales bacterium]MCP5001459.1 hypothetical protein [Hyphomicrobiales bacterium]
MDASNQSSVQPEITLDRSTKPRGRRGGLNLDAKEALLRLYANGDATAAIADRFGIDETYVRKLASRYGIRKGNLTSPVSTCRTRQKEPEIGKHLCAYKKAWRRFDLPTELEPRYIRLLVSGLSRRDAARKLGLTGVAYDSQ